MLMPLWWAEWPERSALSWLWSWLYIYVQLIKSNRVDIKVALYCELTSTLGKR